ncbi:unnamed protein product [Clonostachys rosea]|uniref:Clr5 domain-containing protein n=1 Tax=Bionectria ochroleuca TaxID=29856 RepID=A0ABY6V660_BIOOC|nr:unnamed protein product [Clonostachys rosea]
MDSIWVQHKDSIQRLYVEQRKTLTEVKQIMEKDFGFPESIDERSHSIYTFMGRFYTDGRKSGKSLDDPERQRSIPAVVHDVIHSNIEPEDSTRDCVSQRRARFGI